MAPGKHRDEVLSGDESSEKQPLIQYAKRKTNVFKISMFVLLFLVICACISVAIWELLKPGKKKSPDPVTSCRKIPNITHSSIDCTDGFNAFSTCTVNCNSHHEIQGNGTLTCTENGKWNSSFPSCTCPPCFVGPGCDESVRWLNVAMSIKPIPMTPYKVRYGGHQFTCRNVFHMHYLQLTYHGECVDQNLSYTIKCSKNGKGYKSSGGAGLHTAAELIRKMVAGKKYPEPCDPQDMPTSC